MIHRLLRGQARQRRQHAECIAGQEDDVLRVITDTIECRVGDCADVVGTAGIFRQGVVIEVEPAVFRVESDVLEHGAEPVRGTVNLGFVLRGELDHLGVASALEIENAVVAPAMFVIADEDARLVRRERRLARAAEPEEESSLAVCPDVCGAVHRQDTLVR